MAACVHSGAVRGVFYKLGSKERHQIYSKNAAIVLLFRHDMKTGNSGPSTSVCLALRESIVEMSERLYHVDSSWYILIDVVSGIRGRAENETCRSYPGECRYHINIGTSDHRTK
jgi:hypothetical protein